MAQYSLWSNPESSSLRAALWWGSVFRLSQADTPPASAEGERLKWSPEKIMWEESVLYAIWQPHNCNPKPPTSQLHPAKLVLGFLTNTGRGLTQAKAWCFSASSSTYFLSGCTEIWKSLPGHSCLPLLSKFTNDIKDETWFRVLLNLLPKFCENVKKFQPCVFQL